MIADRYLEFVEFLGRHRSCMGYCILVWNDGHRVLAPAVEVGGGRHRYAVHPHAEVLESESCIIMEFSL